MPLPERVIQPVNVSRGTLQFNVPDVLEGCTNGTLANIIRQLSSLSRHAEEMFGNLFKEAEAVASRSSNLQARIDRLAIRVTQLDSTVEEVSLQDIQLRKAFRSSQAFDQQVVSKETMPKAMLEAYMACDKPPPLDKLNPYREDGKDGVKFYTDPTYFFELWRQEMLKDTERMMHDRGKKHPTKTGNHLNQNQNSKDGGRHKKRVRQPHSTNERQRQKALARGEFILQNELENNVDFEESQQQMMRPNSIEVVKSAAYYQQLQLQQQQQNQQMNHHHSINYNNVQQENIYMPRVLKNFAEHESSPRNFNAPLATEEQLSPSRIVGSPSRPSQPPPAPPPEITTPTRQRDSLPPPPPPPPTSEVNIIHNGFGNGHFGGVAPAPPSGDDLPPPPPHPENNMLTARIPVEHLPPSPPPPPAPSSNAATPTVTNVSVTGGVVPAPPAPPPPPPPPTEKLNGLRITNGDVKENLKNEKSASSPTKTDGSSGSALIMPQKKPSQPPHFAAQDGVRSDLLKAIRDGIALKKVEQRENAKKEEANGTANTTDVASILARRVAVEMSDSDNENASDSEYDSDDWGDESTA